MFYIKKDYSKRSEIYCQLCNECVYNYYIRLHADSRKHQMKLSKESMAEKITRSVVLKGKLSVKLMD